MSNLSFLKNVYTELYKIRHIDWEKLYSYPCVNQFTPGGSKWDKILRDWLNKAGNDLGNYILYESNNFFLLSGEDKKTSKMILSSSEKSLKHIRKIFNNCLEEERWKIVVILFSKPEKYLDYLEYYNKNSFSTASGFFLANAGYQHIVVGPNNDLFNTEITIAHELTHYILSSFQLPRWLDEGFAVNIENQLYKEKTPITSEDHKKHKTFWTKQNIEKFLNDETFDELDPSLAYQLAENITAGLLNHYKKKEIVKLIKNISWGDGGIAGFQNQLGINIKDLINQFFQ